MWNLPELLDRYAALAPEFGAPVALSAFHLSEQETEALFSSFDDDYHISRFFSFSEQEGKSYEIGGAVATHVAIDPAIRSIL